MNTTNESLMELDNDLFTNEVHGALSMLVGRLDAAPGSAAQHDVDPEHPALAASWELSRKRIRTVRRNRIVGIIGALTIFGSGSSAAIMAKNRHDKQEGEVIRVAEQNANTEGVLIPDWTPDGTKNLMLTQEGRDIVGGQGDFVRSWSLADGKGTIEVTSFMVDGEVVGMPNLDKALSQYRPAASFLLGASWLMPASANHGPAIVTISLTGGMLPKEEFARLAKSVTLDTNGHATLVTSGKLTYEGDRRTPWAISTRTSGPGDVFRIIGLKTNTGISSAQRYGTETEIRGTIGSVSSGPTQFVMSPGAQDLPYSVSISWSENSFDYTVSASSESNARKVAESLRPATLGEVETMQRLANFPAGWSATADPVRVVDEVDLTEALGKDGIVRVRSGEVMTDAGCANIKITFGPVKSESPEKIETCLKVTDSPVLWSSVQNVAGKKVLIALVSDSVDAARVIGKDTPAVTGPVSEDSITTEYTSGNIVSLSKDGNESKWIGVVALPVKDGDEILETFRNVARDAPPVPDVPTTDVAHPNYDDEIVNNEPLMLISVNRTEIKN